MTYPSGERRTFSVVQLVKPESSELEYEIAISHNGYRQAVGPFDGTKWAFRTVPLLAGPQDFVFQLFSQPKRKARAVLESISNAELLIFELSRQLSHETDPDIRAEIEAEISKATKNLNALNILLSSLRSNVGGSISVTLNSN